MIRLVLIAAVLGLAPAALPQQPYQPPRTPEGRPDLEGVWISPWLTPLERQPGAKALAFASEEVEAAARAEWARHDAIDPIEGTHTFEFTTFLTIRGEMRSSLIVDPTDGRLPFTEQTRARRTAAPAPGVDGPEQRPLTERCLSSGNGVSPHLAAPSSNIRKIVQTRDHVVIHTELFSMLRIIPIDGRVGIGIRREQTAGRWEGDTLIVTTTDIPDPVRGARGSLFPVTPLTKITERFRRTGADEIHYAFTVEDPQLYTRPWTGETVMLRSDGPMFEFACHEGNYGLANILSGARVTEQRAAAKAGSKEP